MHDRVKVQKNVKEHSIHESLKTMLQNLPEDLIYKVINLLPLLDRASVACTSWQLNNLSRQGIADVDVELCTLHEAKHLVSWLSGFSYTSSESLQRLRICIPSLAISSLGYRFWRESLSALDKFTIFLSLSNFASIKSLKNKWNKDYMELCALQAYLDLQLGWGKVGACWDGTKECWGLLNGKQMQIVIQTFRHYAW